MTLNGYMHFIRDPRSKKQINITRLAAQLEIKIFLDGYYKAWAMGCGPCLICRVCNPESCRYPQYARPSMEACGIDVYATARKAGFPIEVVINYDQISNRYALILIE
jgi:predicted metal-binding protein